MHGNVCVKHVQRKEDGVSICTHVLMHINCIYNVYVKLFLHFDDHGSRERISLVWLYLGGKSCCQVGISVHYLLQLQRALPTVSIDSYSNNNCID